MKGDILKPKHNTSITVLTRREFEDAVYEKYRTIVVQGEFADILRKELNKSTTGKKAGLVASIASLLTGFVAWPMFIVGMVGLQLSSDELSKYQFSSDEKNITLNWKG